MLTRIITAIVGAVFAFGISIVPASAQGQPYDADTNGANPGTHTAVVQHGAKRLVAYTDRTMVQPFPYNTLGVRFLGAYAQDQAAGVQGARIVVKGQQLANAEGQVHQRGLQTTFIDQTGPAFSSLGGWETFGPVLAGNGPLSAPNPYVTVEAQWDAFDCPVALVAFDANTYPSTPFFRCSK